MSTANNDRFNAEAAAWDSNPTTVRSSELAFEAIQQYVSAVAGSKAKTLNVLEIGCGTGLLSFKLAPLVHSLIGVDTAEGMIDAFEKKVLLRRAESRMKAAENLKPVKVLLEDPDDAGLQAAVRLLMQELDHDAKPWPFRWDLIVSHLTLHHIPNVLDILGTMYRSLKAGGQVALTDFEDDGPNAIHFHPKEKREGVERHGIKKEEMAKLMEEAGFTNVKVETAFKMFKEVDKQETGGQVEREFPFLICLGTKPEAAIAK
ncbi:S-adenosyl-L-methionine-dependent methyltransferase [Saccharata proteae CBS 121410]|uniref:S-adenosyl-L-methionine-dependent methyltransferase n=1 Tax=Saccharata proteae CBS 121410 TaxID=1314787 RepID=A0A9P4HYS8_9PEZI|nr:S-adenosyl-L-methionine-dependent methyltransferase [Saccharata proteae CBS 121410]